MITLAGSERQRFDFKGDVSETRLPGCSHCVICSRALCGSASGLKNSGHRAEMSVGLPWQSDVNTTLSRAQTSGANLVGS